MSLDPSAKAHRNQPLSLRANDHPVLTRTVMIAAGQTLARGALLGRVSADDSFKLSETSASDGSEVPSAILFDDVDTSDGALNATVYVRGGFDEGLIIFGTGHDAASVQHDLDARGIHLIAVQSS